MANKIWNVEVGGQQHTVEADYSMWSGARWIEVDGVRVHEGGGIGEDLSKIAEMGSLSYQVPIANRQGVATFNLLRAEFDIDISLAMDGRVIA